MAVKLIITERGDASSEYMRSFLQDRIAIGRARSADICLPDMAISTRHAEIRIKDNDYAIVDLDSLNGTEVNGKKLVAHRPRILKNGDRIVLGDFRVQFGLGAGPGQSEPRDAPERHARQMLARILARTGQIPRASSLIVVHGPAKGSRFDLPRAPASVVIGSGRDTDICLDDDAVSRKHVEILVEPEGVFLRDLKSRNGTIVGGERVGDVQLEPGTHFTVGGTTIALEHPTQSSLEAIFEAPEEETSSFAVGWDVEPAPVSEDAPAGVEETPGEPEPRPIGPADPLLEEAEPPVSRTTGDISIPSIQGNSGSDLGLIIVGAIIVVASVIGLVYIFA